MKHDDEQQISVLIDEIEERINIIMTLKIIEQDSKLKTEMGTVAASLADFFEFSLSPKLKNPGRGV